MCSAFHFGLAYEPGTALDYSRAYKGQTLKKSNIHHCSSDTLLSSSANSLIIGFVDVVLYVFTS